MKERISRIRFEFLLEEPFLGDLSLRLIVKEDKEGTPTMSTNTRHLFYNPAYVRKLPDNHLKGVVAHEIAHNVFGHAGLEGKKRRKDFDPKVWGIACEYMANYFVVDMCRLSLPGKPYYNKKYSDGRWTTEDIYHDIINNHHVSEKGCSLTDDHSQWGSHSHADGNDKHGNLDSNWKIWLTQALHSAKRAGNIAAGLERFVCDILEPEIDWRYMLAEFVVSATKDDYSWRRLNRRHLHRGIYAPALYSETVNIGFAMDTSGSMSTTELQEGLAELRGICNAFPLCNLHLFACDAALQHHQEVVFGEEIDITGMVRGGGGTVFSPVFEKIRDDDINMDCLVYFTDAEGAFPAEQPEYPVLWVVKGKGEIPFGRRCEL